MAITITLLPNNVDGSGNNFFYAIGTLIGGVGAPSLFGALIQSGSRWHVSWGYFLGAALMLTGAIAELTFGVQAEGKSLESISQPIQSQ